MKTRTHHTDPRNIPVHPGAMTPAELTRRTWQRIGQAAAALALVLANIAFYTAIFLAH